jgi:hypothetical protein
VGDLRSVVDIFRNETGNLAHYVLPGLSFLQRPDLPFLFPSVLRLQPVSYIQYTDRVVEPDGEQRDECQILLDLARAAGVSTFGLRPAQWLLQSSRSRSVFGIGSERLFDLAALALGLGGVCSLRRHPHGWGYQKATGLGIARKTRGVNANLLTADGPENLERLSGMAHRTGMIVEVRRAERALESVE